MVAVGVHARRLLLGILVVVVVVPVLGVGFHRVAWQSGKQFAKVSIGGSTVHENCYLQQTIGTNITDQAVNAEKKERKKTMGADWRDRQTLSRRHADTGVGVVVAHGSSVCACSGEQRRGCCV
jgi:hypothetical protein